LSLDDNRQLAAMAAQPGQLLMKMPGRDGNKPVYIDLNDPA
jgi:hypothetical protein